MIEAKLTSRVKALVFVAMAASLLAGCGSGIVAETSGVIRPAKSQFSGTHPHDFSVHGIDVSKYQGDIDWRAVKNSGVGFAYIKATEGGNHLDSKFQANWDGARAVGIPRGAYHFVWWCRSPHEEIDWFKRNVPADPDALPPVLDVEATPTSRTCKRRLQRDEVVRDMRIMLQDMERHYGKRPVIYTTVDFYEAMLAPNELSEYPIWVRSTKYSPHVKYGNRKWHFWQYQSDGVVAGIPTPVDRNAFHGDASSWLAFARGTGPAMSPSAPVPTRQVQPEPMLATIPPPVMASAAPLSREPMALMPPVGLADNRFPPR